MLICHNISVCPCHHRLIDQSADEDESKDTGNGTDCELSSGGELVCVYVPLGFVHVFIHPSMRL